MQPGSVHSTTEANHIAVALHVRALSRGQLRDTAYGHHQSAGTSSLTETKGPTWYTE